MYVKSFSKLFQPKQTENENGYHVYNETKKFASPIARNNGPTPNNIYVISYKPYIFCKYECNMNRDFCTIVDKLKSLKVSF